LSKAFDKVNLYAFFIKLMKRKCTYSITGFVGKYVV